MNTRMIISTAAAIGLLGLFTSCAPGSSYQNFSNDPYLNSNIIGGVDSTAAYQKENGIVGVMMVTEDQLGRQMSGVCTGSLIAPNVVLTAAHCMVLSKGSKLVAFLVMFDRSLDTIMEEISNKDLTHVRIINKVVRHEAFMNGRDTNNDIGLLGFQGQIPADFKLAHMASSQLARTLRAGTDVTLAGFGVSDYKKDNSTGQFVGSGDGLLRQINGIKVLSLTTTGQEITLDQSQGRGACHGDSGGPAYIVDQVTKQNILVGVTSRGTSAEGSCGGQAIYTGVMGYSQWIADSLKKAAQ